jgi:hypothetical protein
MFSHVAPPRPPTAREVPTCLPPHSCVIPATTRHFAVDYQISPSTPQADLDAAAETVRQNREAEVDASAVQWS